MNKHIFSIVIFCMLFFVGFAQVPTGLNGTAYNTTVHLQWDEFTGFQAVGYNIYRSNVSESYGLPSRRVGAYINYTDYNLLPNTTYYYKIAAFDAAGNESSLSDEIMVATDNNNYLKVASLDLLIPIYTGGMSATAPEEIMQGLEFSRGIFYRNSYCQLNLKFHYMIIDGYPPLNADGVATFPTIEGDLRARGILDNQYDAIHVEALKLYGWYGGAQWMGQTAGSMAYNWTGFDADNHYTRGDAWVFTHEFGHSLDLIIAKKSGYPEMIYNHYAWAHPMTPDIGVFDAGENFDGMALVLRLFEHHLDYKAPYDGYIEVVDADNDGLADNDSRLFGDEFRFSSNPNLIDTDNDGLDDLTEYTADVYQGSDPNNTDTDNDGIVDGIDIYPASNFQPVNEKAMQAINIDGVINSNESWNEMGSDPFYSKIPDASLNTYTTWDDNYLYFAFQSNQHLKYYLLIDGNGKDGIFASSVKWSGGDYGSINANAWGISYFDQASLIIRANDTQVYKKEEPIAGSQVSTVYSNGIYTTEVRLPHNLGPGFGHSYVYPTAPEITELTFSENDTLGIQLVATPLIGSNSYDWADWRVKDWLILDQPFHYYDMVFTGNGGPTGELCDSYGEFPWHEWIAKVELADLSHISGKSPYSDFTSQVSNVTAGENYPVNLTTGFSYFTWDEYWRIWIDLNQDGDFADAGELVFSEILNAPPAGTLSESLTGNLGIPSNAQAGLTRMRVSMKRGSFPTPCEIIPFGEVEDYMVNIGAPIQYPNLLIPNYEVIPSNSACFNNPGVAFNFLGGTLLNSGDGNAAAFNLKVTLSKDDQPSDDDVFWQEFQFIGLNANTATGFQVDNPVPSSLPTGKYFIIFEIDTENNIPETEESDNTLATSVFIGAPDFKVEEVTNIPTNSSEGSSLDVTAMIVNISPFPLTELAGDLPVKLYLSEDDGFSLFSDVEIGAANISYNQFTNAPLYNGGTATVNISAQLPASITPGEYFIFALVTKYCEQSQNNNISVAYPIQINLSDPEAYCDSYGEFPWHEWIAGVEIANLKNTSGKSNYTDFTSKVADVWAGQIYSINLTTGYSYFTWDEYWTVWIDFNKDGDFTDAGETVFSEVLQAPANGTSKAILSDHFSIPANAPAGTTRMRVSMKRDAFPGPCEIIPFGEVEDYTISISTGCNITVATGNIQCQNAGTPTDPTDDTFTFEVLAIGSEVSQNWQMTWPGGTLSGTFSVVQPIGPLLISDFPNGLTFSIFDNVNANCATSGTIIPPSACSTIPVDEYCEPNSVFPWEDWIAGVKLNDLEHNSGKSPYSDFTNKSATLEKSVFYEIELTAGYSWFTWDEYWSVWIDWNQDFIFQPIELVYSGLMSAPTNGTPSEKIIGGVELPPNVLLGETRMRVIMSMDTITGPCENIPFGEIEDYTVFIVDQKPGQGTEDRSVNIEFEAIREKVWIDLYGVYRFLEKVTQVEIERSDNNTEFELIETIQLNGVADVMQLVQTKDDRPMDGLNYYRLRFLFENGKEIYSDVQKVDFEKPFDLTIFPNPARDEIFVHLDVLPENATFWVINDAYGQIVWKEKTDSGIELPFRISTEKLKPGMYYLNIQRSGMKAKATRFVVVR